MIDNLEYIPREQFEEKVKEFAKDNFVLKSLFNHPTKPMKSWEELPSHLIKDLFKKLNCKPIIMKY